MTKDDLKATVSYFLREQAEALLEGRRPELTLGFEVSRASRAQHGWQRAYAAEVAARTPALEAAYVAEQARYEAAVRALMVQLWKQLVAELPGRVRNALRHRAVPADMRRWAERQVARATEAKSVLGLAYVVLTLRSVVEWEAAHEATDAGDPAWTALDEEQARWVAAQTLEQDEYPGFDEPVLLSAPVTFADA